MLEHVRTVRLPSLAGRAIRSREQPQASGGLQVFLGLCFSPAPRVCLQVCVRARPGVRPGSAPPRAGCHSALSRSFGTGVATMADSPWVFCLLLLTRSDPYAGEAAAFHGPPCPDGATERELGAGESEGQGQVGGRWHPLRAKNAGVPSF